LVAQISSVTAAALFILSLYWMNDPKSAARLSVPVGALALLLAVAAVWLSPEIVTQRWILAGLIAGIVVGIPLSRVALTAAPQRTALSHSFGGLAAALVGTAKFLVWTGEDTAQLTTFRTAAIVVECLLGAITMTGSLMAAAKLQGLRWIPQRPIVFAGQIALNLSVLSIAIGLGIYIILNPTAPDSVRTMFILLGLSSAFGVLLILRIGGADMPTVISILNSYAGLSAVAMGLALDIPLLIVAGALDGASGLILSIIMCRAMNRSFTNVLLGGFGQIVQTEGAKESAQYKTETTAGAALMLEMARNVVIVPGYGMAVAQAQHRLRDIYDQLLERGISVKFVIHPVAGRMPGHMNVLLAEAEIPYDDIVEMDDINPEMPQIDVALVVGANDVVNPAAKESPGSPIYGMPIIEVHRAKAVLAIKRSTNTGFAGIDNDLYFQENTFMLFGDAKHVIGELAKQLTEEQGQPVPTT
jgi:NAD(P) transhydrogenase subunit beta